MIGDKRLHALNALSSAEYQHLVDGYTRVANDIRVPHHHRLKARRRVRLLQLSRLPTRVGEVGVN